VFENILHQPLVLSQLKADLDSATLAPSILFSGPEYAGKGTTALELTRVLCCEENSARGKWNCPCSSCVHHRNLVSPDLLIMGRRHFFEEIAAAARAFLRHPENSGSRMLFIRAVRKLLARFNGVLWEDDPKLGKLKSQIGVLEEELEDFEALAVSGSIAKNNGGGDTQPNPSFPQIEKLCESIGKKAVKLEAEGLGELIPIAQIRRAAYWSHLAPLGNHKCIIIEGAENMQDGAKNSLLKILEEPPPRLTMILTSSRPMSLLPTMLSRLREYRFAKRSAEAEAEIIARVFREELQGSKDEGVLLQKTSIQSYLTSFLPVNSDTLYSLGAFFAASAAAGAVRELRARQREIPAVLADLGKYAAPIAEKGGMGRPAGDFKSALAKILDTAEHFEIPGLFTRFLQQCCALLSGWLWSGEGSAEKTVWADLWRRELNRSRMENDSYNISPPLALERLFDALKTGMT